MYHFASKKKIICTQMYLLFSHFKISNMQINISISVQRQQYYSHVKYNLHILPYVIISARTKFPWDQYTMI